MSGRQTKEAIAAYNKEYYAKNKEKIAAYKLNYNAKNRDKKIAYWKERYAKKKEQEVACKVKPVPVVKLINRGEFDRTTYCFRYHHPCKKYVDCLNEGYTAAKKAWPEVLGCFKSDTRTERIHGDQSGDIF